MNYVNTVTGPVAASELGRTPMQHSVVLKKKNIQETV